MYAVPDGVCAKRRPNGTLFEIFNGRGKRAGAKHQGQVVGALLTETPFNHSRIVDAAVDDRGGLDAMVEDNGHAITDVLLREGAEPPGGFRREREIHLPATGIPSVAILNRSAQIAASYDRGAIQDIPNVSRVRSANAVVRAGRQQFGTSRKHGVLCHISGNGGIRGGIPDQAQLQLAASLNYCFGFGGIADARQLHQDFIGVAASARHNRGFGKSQSIDALLDGFSRLRHRLFLNGGDGAGAKGQSVAVGLPRGGGDIPNIVVLRADEVAQRAVLGGVNILDQDVQVVDAANFVVVDIFAAQHGGDAVDGSVGFLRDGFPHLNLKNQVAPTLEVQAKLNLILEIVFHLRERSGEGRIAEKEINAQDDNNKNEQRFPFEMGFHGWKIGRLRRTVGLFCIFRCLHLCNRRTRDSNFNLRLRGDLQNNCFSIEAADGAVNAAAGNDLVAGLKGGEHRLCLFALALLRHDHHEIHDAKHERQRDQEGAEAAA